ncbi:MAG: hypothetical protein Q7U75_11995, partial [Desulfobacterales bacterium]|nr:hypothetical protein [Desulfobacterales bacterium]
NDYAVLSATVYNKVRGDKNQLPVPANWTEVDNDLNHPITGFAASAYRNGNDVVIAFRGTENLMDGVADLLLGVGLGSAQLTQAALFYQVVKAANPGANISFAGHSLGGGLASVMSVWFDRPAVVFNEAPFEATALNPLLVKATAFALNEAGPGDPALDRLADANRFADLSALYTLRETQVTNYYMPGEFLVPLRGLLPTVAGTNNPVTTLGTGATGTFDLHSINLLAARLLEPKLGTLGYRLPTLVKQLFSTEARAADLNSQSRDFLTNILADQISKGYDSQDGLLAKFAADIDTLTNGLPLSGDKAIDLAVRLGIEHYYHMLDNGVGEPLFGQVGSGIQADLNKFVVGLDQIKPYGELRQFALDAADDADARDAITEFITDKRRWNIAVGNGGLSGSADGDVSDIVLGGKGADDFDAGAGDDLLIGGAGTDDLQGDAG